jgi:hypothetical protein
MRNPALRLLLVLVLFGAAGAGALLVREAPRPAAATPDPRFDERVDRLLLLVHDLHLTQVAYVAPYQDAASALTRFPSLVREITSIAAQAAALAATEDAAAAWRRFVDATSDIVQLDATLREHLLRGDDLTAAHLVHGEGQAATRAMQTALVQARTAEHRAPAPEDTGSRSAATVFTIVAALWAVGLIALAILPAGGRAAAGVPGSGPAATAAAGGAAASAPGAAVADQGSARPVDMTMAAELCADIARVERAAAIPALLDRAAGLLGAQRVVIWLGSGRQLFAAASSSVEGVPPDGPIPAIDDDAHPVAVSWRTGVSAVAGGAEGGPHVVASPLCAGSVCRGALGVELTGEADGATRALVTMLAAQFSAVVAGAPADPGVPSGTGT